MTIFACFDEGGFPKGFYDSEEIAVAKMPPDIIEITAEQHSRFLELHGGRRWLDGDVVDYMPPPPPITLDDYSRAIDAMLDAKAQERQYDSVRTAVTYRDDPNPQFAAEGQALFEWRSAVWTYATEQLAKVQAGERAQPSVADFMTEIEAACPFAWPIVI